MIKLTNSKFNKKGFTLIEMLIVISIIGILASIVLVGLGAFRSRGRDTRRIADLRETQGALELYYTKFQVYPTSLGGSSSWSAISQAIVNGGVGVNTVSNDPLFNPLFPSSKTYTYGVSSDRQEYVLMATLEDGSHPALKDDIDRTVFSVNCEDSPKPNYNYCVRL